MQKMKSFLLICLCAALLLAGCGKNKTETPAGAATTYTISVASAGGMGLKDVSVYVYEDSTLQELVAVIKTDAEGKASFTDAARDTYVAVLKDIPTGYAAEEFYALTGELTQIVLNVGQMDILDMEDLTYKLGDAMMNFSVTSPEGTEYTFNDLIKDKKAVVLNFFYNECQPCRNEFPFLQEAYEQYRDDIAVLAMNPVNTDGEAVAALRKQLDLTFPMVVCDPKWESIMQITAYPTTVIIDRYGNICLIHKGSVPDTKTFTDAFAYFVADDYEQKLIEAIGDLAVEEEEGTKENPTEVGGVSSFEVTVKPGQVVYSDIYKVTNMYLTIKNKNAYVIYKDKTYYPENGVVSVKITTPDTFTPTTVGIGNSGSQTETFKASIVAPTGTFDNPNKLKLGDFTAKVAAGNEQGVYYTYKATEDGTLTLKCISAPKNVKYSYFLFNTTTNAMRNLESDSQTAADGTVTVSVQAKKGQTVQVCISTLPDDKGGYPAATFKFNASFVAGQITEEEQVKTTEYTVTVTDTDNAPVANVSVLVKVEDQDMAFTTDAQGVAKITLPTGTYEGSFYVPDGYTAQTMVFTLTEAEPNVKLTVAVIQKADYTVTVQDEAGAPLANVLVKIGDSQWQSTDEQGKMTLTLDVGSYSVTLMLPDGYAGETVYVFPENSTELSVTLTAITPEEPEEPEEPTEPSEPEDPTEPEEPTVPEEPQIYTYTVTVTDAFGAAFKDLGVMFLRDGAPVKMATTDANGMVSMETDDSTALSVELVFTDTVYYYDKAAAVLSPTSRQLTVKLYSNLDESDFQEIYILNGNPAYTLYEGGTHVSLGSGRPNFSAEYGNNCFFVFTPETAGTYQFTAAPNVELSYWSTPNYVNRLYGSHDEGKENALTMSISGSSVGNTTYVIGVKADTDVTEAVVTVARIGDPEFSIADQPWAQWESGISHTNAWMTETGTTAGSNGYTYNFQVSYLDITAADGTYNLHYDEANGYYRLGEGGPVVLVDLGAQNRFVSLFERVNGKDSYGGSSVTRYFFNDTGAFARKEDYTDFLNSCFEEMLMSKGNPKGYYPLTKDLMHVLQNGFVDWWNPDSPNYLESFATANKAYAWMFPCCIVK